MINIKPEVFQAVGVIFVSAIGITVGHSQVKPSPPIVKDEFSQENQRRLLRRERAYESAKKRGVATSGIRIFDEPPGSTGLKLTQSFTSPQTIPAPLVSLTYSVLGSFAHDSTPLTTDVVDFSAQQTHYLFTNGLESDYGYVFDPLWMSSSQNPWLVLKAGRPGATSVYQLYGYQKSTGRIHRLSPVQLKNRVLTLSPDHRYLTYVAHGGTLGVDSIYGDFKPLELWVWDSQTEHNFLVTTNDGIEGSYSWRSRSELFYSQIETRANRLLDVTYVWNSLTKESKEWMANCRGVVLSPDKTQAIYNAQIDPLKRERAYKIKNLKTGAVLVLNRTYLGKVNPDDPSRQIVWSPDSRFVFSVLNHPSQVPTNLFVYDTHSRKSVHWPVVKPKMDAKILAISSKGQRVFLLREEVTGQNNVLYEFNHRYNVVEVNSANGRQRTLWSKENLLGLNSNSVILSKQILQD